MFSRKLYWLLKKDDIKKHIKMCCKMYWLTKTEVSHNRYVTLDYISDYLNKSKGTVRKIVEELLQSGQIVRIGNGPKTRYRVVKTTE